MYRPLFVEVEIPPRCISSGCRRESPRPGVQCEVCDLLDSMLEELLLLGAIALVAELVAD